MQVPGVDIPSRSKPAMTNIDYEEIRQQLLPIAKNLLEDPDDARDLVQETIEKSLDSLGENIRNPRAYLTRTLINRCLNFIRNRKRLEHRPVEIASELLDNIDFLRVENEPILKLAIQALLEKLTPDEQAVLLLSEAFEFSHREIAHLLGIKESHSRQLLRRSRIRLTGDKKRFQTAPEKVIEFFERFVEAGREAEIRPFVKWIRGMDEVDTPQINGELRASGIVYPISNIPCERPDCCQHDPKHPATGFLCSIAA